MSELSGAAVVILAGGMGTRVGAGVNKALLTIGGLPVVARSVRTAVQARPSRVVVVVRPEDRHELSNAIQPVLGEDEVWIVDGGVERHDSEWNALRALAASIESGEIDVVAIHDAARPLASVALYREVIAAARAHGGAIPTVAMDHLLGPEVDDAEVEERTARHETSPVTKPPNLVAVQTPQAFRAPDLLTAYRRADRERFKGTDTAACVERFSDLTIVGVPSSVSNLKVTYPEDLAVAEQLLLQP